MNSNLACFQTEMLPRCKSLTDLYGLLEDFNDYNWNLMERSAFSSAYTPLAQRLIYLAGRDEDKRFILEDLASLCWNKPHV